MNGNDRHAGRVGNGRDWSWKVSNRGTPRHKLAGAATDSAQEDLLNRL
jgi:hypothetical protein